jgi:cyclohexanecarboxylate-CoA ligase
LLDSHSKVLQSPILPMPDPVLGERACCFVTLRAGPTRKIIKSRLTIPN